MKVNIFLTLIGIMIATLIGYLVFNIAEGKDNDILCGIGSTICFATTLIPAIGLQYDSGRLGINIRITAFLFFVAFLVSNFCFAGIEVIVPYYIVTNGILLTIFLAIFYKMQDIKSI